MTGLGSGLVNYPLESQVAKVVLIITADHKVHCDSLRLCASDYQIVEVRIIHTVDFKLPWVRTAASWGVRGIKSVVTLPDRNPFAWQEVVRKTLLFG